ncbi:helix-turn-helix domain-containing protein [Acinetobacter sp. dk771]|uniref:Helix-turn-helix domain-containing protein n=1 Tax=Acinetobacter wanghuae TaxID=2662362 RepID=A0AA91AI07_9GAMM|nr:helix-turn-helix domain-containing protein [Acinetobacter wanghuae]
MYQKQNALWLETNPDIANIPSNYARLIGRELALNIRELPQLLQFTQLSPERLMQDETLLTARQLVQILQNSVALSEHADFGLRLGQRLTPTTHGAMGFLVNSSPNLLMALKAFQEFIPTRISFARLNLEYTENSVHLSLYFDFQLSEQVHRLLAETCAVIIFECAEFIVGRPMHEAEICFAHAEPDYHQAYAQYLPGTYSFSAAEIKATFPLSLCHIPNASANQDSYLLALQQCESMLQQLKPSKQSYVYLIKKMMLSSSLHELSEEQIAAALFMSKRTLARKLAAEGTSFKEIKDAILSEQAGRYLTDSPLSVDAIATLLNYHDSSNFRRAFKRWFGVTPNEYRLKNTKHMN